MSNKKILIANWKANPDSLKEAVFMAKKIESDLGRLNVDVVIAPPFPFLSEVGKVLKKAKLGAQDVFWAKSGPYTGEVSVNQLKNLGVKYVIVGHSERRLNLDETDEMINKKILSLLENGLKPILCTGEKERKDSASVIKAELQKGLKGVQKKFLKNLIVAYEPIWAISTSPGAIADNPDNAFRIKIYIKKIISDLYGRESAEKVKIIYGGSVDSKNIKSFLKDGGMDGALVGGASLKPEEFLKIIKEAA